MRTLSFIFNNGEARSFGRRIAAFDAAARAEPWPACIHKIFWNAETVFDRLRYILYNVMLMIFSVFPTARYVLGPYAL